MSVVAVSSVEREQWRDVPEYEGYYEVSDRGTVRSVDRVITDCRGVRRAYKGKPRKVALNRDGYPTVNLARGGRVVYKTVGALVAAAFIGPRPHGMLVCHEDDNPKNNRPGNLRYDTPSGNTRDAVERKRHRNSRKEYCVRGHQLEHPNLRRSALPVRLCRSCDNARVQCLRKGLQESEFQIVSDRLYQRMIKRHESGPIRRVPIQHRRLTANDVVEIRQRYKEGLLSTRELGAEYGISGTQIHKIVTRKAWRNVPVLGEI